MDGSQIAGVGGANNSSDFVSSKSRWGEVSLQRANTCDRFESCTSKEKHCLRGKDKDAREIGNTDNRCRMLEDPSYAAVVRWGDEGDSFVVLEVGHRAAQ